MRSLPAAAVLVAFFVGDAAAQQPMPPGIPPSPSPAECAPGAQPYPATHGYGYGGYGYGNCCYEECDDCSYLRGLLNKGYVRQCYYNCKARIQASWARNGQVTSPVFKTHPFARSPRDYFMYD
jgi:hypothetical protein